MNNSPKNPRPHPIESGDGGREVIASGAVSRVERCGCGSLYLTLGPVTMAVHPEAMLDLSATLARAAAILNGAAGAMAAAERADRDGEPGDEPVAERARVN